jgi:hypothetical protein
MSTIVLPFQEIHDRAGTVGWTLHMPPIPSHKGGSEYSVRLHPTQPNPTQHIMKARELKRHDPIWHALWGFLGEV